MQFMADQLKQKWPVIIPTAGLGVVVLGGVVYLLRSRGRKPGLPAPAASARLASASGAPADTASRGPGEASAPEPAALPSPARQLARLAQTEPEQLARIVRGWLAEEERAER
jgi:flagellar biosynthesis/type III secretory pathway M-ring protein FliF/YscJ